MREARKIDSIRGCFEPVLRTAAKLFRNAGNFLCMFKWRVAAQEPHKPLPCRLVWLLVRQGKGFLIGRQKIEKLILSSTCVVNPFYSPSLYWLLPNKNII